MDSNDTYDKFYDELSDPLKEYCKHITRQEKYLAEKDAIGHSNFFGSEDELYKVSIVKYIINRNNEIAEKESLREQIMLLHKALESLKDEYPEEYDIIRLYYFSSAKISMKRIGKMKKITKQSVSAKMKKGYNHLREYIIFHKNT